MNKLLFLSIGMFSLGLDAYITTGLLHDIGQSFGTNIVQNAQTITVFTLFYALSAPLFSTILAKWPIRKILILALSIFIFANILSALSLSLEILLFSRAIAGIGAGLFSPMASSAAVALSDKQNKGKALGFIFAGMSSGVVIGVPVGLNIATYLGWQNCFWIITIISILSLCGLLFNFPNLITPPPPSFKKRLSLLTQSYTATTVCITFLIAMISLGLYSYIPSLLQQTSEAPHTIFYLWSWGIGGVVASFTIGILIDKTGKPEWLMIGILIILTLTLLSLPTGLTFNEPWTFLPFIIWGAMGWSYLPSQQHILFSIDNSNGAVAVALNSSFNYLGSSVGTFLGGLLLVYGFTPLQLPYFSAGICFFILLIQILITFIKIK